MALHPLDFAALNKGDIIGQAQLENIFSFTCSAKPEGYRFAVLGLQGQIERERTDLLTRGVNQYDIEVMMDLDAEYYLRKRLAAIVDSLGRITGRRVRIDRTEFESPVKMASESLDRSYQGMALMARSAHRKALRMADLMLRAPDETQTLAEGAKE